MKKFFISMIAIGTVAFFSFNRGEDSAVYQFCFQDGMRLFDESLNHLMEDIRSGDVETEEGRARIKKSIASTRLRMKAVDFWLRYLDPIAYKKINAPLPVEWETEVYEKWVTPYKRDGAGLTLAEMYLDEEVVERDNLLHLIQQSLDTLPWFRSETITWHLASHHHFFLANRLFLMNLAAIYTTGFECPDTDEVIPELRHMLTSVWKIYDCFNHGFFATPLPENYLQLYDRTVDFVKKQPGDFSLFDHFTFIKDYVNPLFGMNQRLINEYSVVSRSLNDYSLRDTAYSIFDKSLYHFQYTKGAFSLVEDREALDELDRVGKLLFYDPILSGNNKRSCASCHNPKIFFTDTTARTPLHFDRAQRLTRNAPSLVNVIYNHLLMIDGKHISLQAQTLDVTTHPDEMGGAESDLVKKVMSCKEYATAFKKLLKFIPGEREPGLRHIVAALTFYYSKFSHFYSPFDEAMNAGAELDEQSIKGFNLFMSKAQCATCHFVPHFNGVKPPYVGSEFEVIGTPADTAFTSLSPDVGRYAVNPADETLNAFRTTTMRNIEFTKPYMHNGVFNTLDEVIDFYDAGGGQGRGLDVPNQTLDSDSLNLTRDEKDALIAFMKSLNEKIQFEEPPGKLPLSSNKALNERRIIGEY